MSVRYVMDRLPNVILLLPGNIFLFAAGCLYAT